MSLHERGDMKAHEEAGYKIPLEPEKTQLINQSINQSMGPRAKLGPFQMQMTSGLHPSHYDFVQMEWGQGNVWNPLLWVYLRYLFKQPNSQS